MSRRIGILGAGNVGATVAMSLVTHNICNELVLVDCNFKKAEAQALDLIDTMPYALSYTRIFGTDDVTSLADVDILINCVGPEKLHEDRLDELAETAAIVQDVFPKIMASGFEGIIVNVTNPCDVITMLIQDITGLPKSRVFGTGTSLDTARLYAHISTTLQVNPGRITGYVLGEHGESQFVAWSTVRIDSFPVDFVLSQMPEGLGFNLEAVEEIVREAGWKIASGKAYTNFGIAQVVTTVIFAIFNNTQTILPLSVYSSEYETYLSTPGLIGRSGIRFTTPALLTDEEEIKLARSAHIIKSAFESVK